MKISTSILNAQDRLKCIKKLNNTSTDYVHIDVMDGKFVPNYQLPASEVNNLIYYTKKPFDIHLMVEKPKEYIKKLNIDKVSCITIHIEINEDIDEIINMIKALNIRVGLAIKPNTNIDLLDKYLDKIDTILVMSVEPGFGGQAFIDTTPERIKQIKSKNKDITIEVDGGINDKNINKIKDIIDIAVVGSYITKKDNYEKAINSLKN